MNDKHCVVEGVCATCKQMVITHGHHQPQESKEVEECAGCGKPVLPSQSQHIILAGIQKGKYHVPCIPPPPLTKGEAPKGEVGGWVEKMSQPCPCCGGAIPGHWNGQPLKDALAQAEIRGERKALEWASEQIRLENAEHEGPDARIVIKDRLAHLSPTNQEAHE